MDQKDGVSVDSPPSCLPYITMPSAKRVRLSNNSADVESASTSTISPSNIELLAELIGLKNGNKPASPDGCSDAPMSSPPNESHIEGYVDFLGIRDRDHTIEILLANRFHSHKVFKSLGLARGDVKDLGLTLGVVTMLFDNVAKYEQALASGMA